METWVAEIKEKGNDHVLKPKYCFTNQFDYIKDKELREAEKREFLVKFWGLNYPDVQWYKLYKQESV